MGDIIYSLPTLLSYESKINLYLRTYPHIDFLKRLLISQDFIIDVKHRKSMESNTPYINLAGYVRISLKKKLQRLVESHLELYNRTYDFANPWVKNIESVHVADIIISRTLKYHDAEQIDWKILKPFEDRSVFIGYVGEWKRFVGKYKLNIKFQKITDGLDLAQM